MKSGHLFFS